MLKKITKKARMSMLLATESRTSLDLMRQNKKQVIDLPKHPMVLLIRMPFSDLGEQHLLIFSFVSEIRKTLQAREIATENEGAN